MKNVIFRLLLIFSVLIVFVQCGKKYHPGSEEKKSGAEPALWQTAWVDPRIIMTDSVLTLIQAGRIDSFKVSSTEISNKKASALEFQISGARCTVEAFLCNTNSKVIRPLMTTSLMSGFYKLSLNPGVAKKLEVFPGRYILRVRTCTGTVNKTVDVT
jgi:hypothetical protein